MMMGWIKPVVLLPTAALAGLSPTQLEALLAHELAHVRRHDYLVNVLQSVVETLLFYHPAVWWVSRQVRIDREHCADDLAVRVCDRLVDASALADLAALAPAPRLALAATDGSLLNRVRRILGLQPAPAASPGLWPIVLVVLLVGAAVPVAIASARTGLYAARDSGYTLTTTGTAEQSSSTAPMATRTGHGSMSYSTSAGRVQLQWTGAFRLTADEKDIAWIAPGASVMITNGRRWLSTGIEAKALADGTIERHHFRTGFTKPFEPDGRMFLESSLQFLVRRAGLDASARVARLLADGGRDAVLAEIDLLESDSVRRLYYREVIGQSNPTSADVAALLERASRQIGSDSSLSSLITATASAVAGDEPSLVAVIQSTRALNSDSYHRRALTELMPAQVSRPVAVAVLDVASEIGSDSERSAVLTTLVERGGLTDATAPAFFALVGSMGSSSYQGRVLRAVSEVPGLPEPILGGALAAARTVGSDTERQRVVTAMMSDTRMTPTTAPRVLATTGAVTSDTHRASILKDFVEKDGLNAATAAEFFALVTTMSSSSYQRQVMQTVIDRPAVAPAVLTGWLQAVSSVSSDTERTRLLLAAVAKHRLTAGDRELYLQASDGISSETNQTKVLAALVRAERGR
jgi:hypothetical protein